MGAVAIHLRPGESGSPRTEDPLRAGGTHTAGMTWFAIGDTLPQAVGIALSPLPLVLVILMAMSARGRTNAPAFVAGWVIGAAAVAGVALLVADVADAATDEVASDGVDLVQLTLGLLFWALAFRQFRNRPRPGTEAPTPRLFEAVDGVGTAKAFGLGVVACVANPKNLPLAVSGGSGIAQAGATGWQGVVAVVVFAVVASVGVAAPVVLQLAMGSRSEAVLSSWKTWLVANNAAVMTVVFALLGASMIGSGLALFA